MLGSDLVRAVEKGDRLEPSWLKPGRADLVGACEQLCTIFAAAKADGWTRARVAEEVDAHASTLRSRKAAMGLARLLEDDATFTMQAPFDPPELRRLLFARAAATGPIALSPDPLGRRTANDVIGEVAAELGIDGEAARASLYADLKENHVLTDAVLPAQPADLIDRYNVALVQALLLRAVEVRLTLSRPGVPRLRQLLRHLKFRQLMHRAWLDGGDLHLVVDGPSSVLQQTTRYGMQLAQLFPAVLLQTCPWTMTASVLWGPERVPRQLTVTHEQNLKSHLPDHGAWTTPEQQMFAERWEALGDTGWEATQDTVPLPMGPHAVALPDWTFRKGDRVAHLDIVGFWRKAWLQRRLDDLRQWAPGNYLLAVSSKLGVEAESLDDFPGTVLPFKQVLPAKSVLEALDRVAAVEPG